jgi:hypothetical protein
MKNIRCVHEIGAYLKELIKKRLLTMSNSTDTTLLISRHRSNDQAHTNCPFTCLDKTPFGFSIKKGIKNTSVKSTGANPHTMIRGIKL